MKIKKFKVIKKDGKAYPQLFDTIKDALREIGSSNITKLEEVFYDEQVSEITIDKKNVVVIARKKNEELEKSQKTGTAPVYNRPVLTKVYEGMTILELGEDKVLESKLVSIGTFNKDIHKGYDLTEKEYGWVLSHLSGVYLTVEEATKKYRELENLTTKENTIIYMSKR